MTSPLWACLFICKMGLRPPTHRLRSHAFKCLVQCPAQKKTSSKSLSFNLEAPNPYRTRKAKEKC